jgi:prolycopene isomerase
MAKADGKTIIAGGGIAGMIAANFIAKAGRSVLVLEQNHHTGGNMSGFNRQGYYFDGGDQSFESLGIVFPLLKDLGIYDKITWTKVRYRFMSKDFDFFLDSFESVEGALKAAFPEEKGLDGLFQEIRTVGRFIDQNCSAHSFPLLNDFSLGRLLALAPKLPVLLKWLTYDYREKSCSQIKNPSLRNWLAGIGYYRMPYLFFAGFWNLWIKDYWYPVGGMQKFHDTLAENLKSLGGELRCNTRVEKIEVKNGKAIGVRTPQGEFFEADQIIYAGDYKALLSGIVEEGIFAPRRVEKFQKAQLTESLFAAYLGVNLPPAELQKRLQAHHTFWFPNYDVIFPNGESQQDIHQKMWVTANFFGEDNPGFAPPGKSTLVLQTYSAASWQNYWGNGSYDRPRTDAYRRMKDQVSHELVVLAENFLPGLSAQIDYLEAGTPLSIQRFSLNSEGSSGGWCYDDRLSAVYKTPLLNTLRTPVPNLITAGHYTVWPGGVISAALSGRFAANIVLGKGILTPLSVKN